MKKFILLMMVVGFVGVQGKSFAYTCDSSVKKHYIAAGRLSGTKVGARSWYVQKAVDDLASASSREEQECLSGVIDQAFQEDANYWIYIGKKYGCINSNGYFPKEADMGKLDASCTPERLKSVTKNLLYLADLNDGNKKQLSKDKVVNDTLCQLESRPDLRQAASIQKILKEATEKQNEIIAGLALPKGVDKACSAVCKDKVCTQNDIDKFTGKGNLLSGIGSCLAGIIKGVAETLWDMVKSLTFDLLSTLSGIKDLISGLISDPGGTLSNILANIGGGAMNAAMKLHCYKGPGLAGYICESGAQLATFLMPGKIFSALKVMAEFGKVKAIAAMAKFAEAGEAIKGAKIFSKGAKVGEAAEAAKVANNVAKASRFARFVKFAGKMKNYIPFASRTAKVTEQVAEVEATANKVSGVAKIGEGSGGSVKLLGAGEASTAKLVEGGAEVQKASTITSKTEGLSQKLSSQLQSAEGRLSNAEAAQAETKAAEAAADQKLAEAKKAGSSQAVRDAKKEQLAANKANKLAEAEVKKAQNLLAKNQRTAQTALKKAGIVETKVAETSAVTETSVAQNGSNLPVHVPKPKLPSMESLVTKPENPLAKLNPQNKLMKVTNPGTGVGQVKTIDLVEGVDYTVENTNKLALVQKGSTALAVIQDPVKMSRFKFKFLKPSWQTVRRAAQVGDAVNHYSDRKIKDGMGTGATSGDGRVPAAQPNPSSQEWLDQNLGSGQPAELGSNPTATQVEDYRAHMLGISQNQGESAGDYYSRVNQASVDLRNKLLEQRKNAKTAEDKQRYEVYLSNLNLLTYDQTSVQSGAQQPQPQADGEGSW